MTFASDSSASQGLSALLRAMRDDNISPGADLQTAAERLRAAGDEGGDALAGLLRELIQSRSGETGGALAVAKGCVMTPALADAVKAVIEAPELRSGHPHESSFSPEIFGDGKIGWTSGTAARLRDLAEKLLGATPRR